LVDSGNRFQENISCPPGKAERDLNPIFQNRLDIVCLSVLSNVFLSGTQLPAASLLRA